MKEIWKDIEGYEGIYQVSNLGNVRSVDRYITTKNGVVKPFKGVIRSLCLNRNGYPFVTLKVKSISKTVEVHRMVAQAFLPNPNNFPCVNHKDENPQNNRVDNLEWCTYKYNSNYGNTQKRKSQNTDYSKCVNNRDKVTIRRKITEKQRKEVYQYDKDLNLIKVWYSASECGRNGFNQGHVSACCRKDKSFLTHKGFIWSYTPLK